MENKWKEKLGKVVHTAKEIILSPFRFFRFLCLLVGFLVISTTVVAVAILFHFFGTMPDIQAKAFNDFKKDSVLKVHRKFDSQKKRKKYFWVPIDKINRELLYAFVMSEDSTYFEHNGVNFNAMIDSLATNIRKREYESGASTITQQVVKNVYLTNEKSLIRKFKEILIARELERRFTKNQILEVYLNISELGPHLYGVGMGSFHYFKKAPKKVNALEGAYMGLMLPSPRRHHLSIHQNKYISKKNRRKMQRVLRDMRYLEYLGPKQYAEYNVFKHFRKLGYSF